MAQNLGRDYTQYNYPQYDKNDHKETIIHEQYNHHKFLAFELCLIERIKRVPNTYLTGVNTNAVISLESIIICYISELIYDTLPPITNIILEYSFIPYLYEENIIFKYNPHVPIALQYYRITNVHYHPTAGHFDIRPFNPVTNSFTDQYTTTNPTPIQVPIQDWAQYNDIINEPPVLVQQDSIHYIFWAHNKFLSNITVITIFELQHEMVIQPIIQNNVELFNRNNNLEIFNEQLERKIRLIINQFENTQNEVIKQQQQNYIDQVKYNRIISGFQNISDNNNQSNQNQNTQITPLGKINLILEQEVNSIQNQYNNLKQFYTDEIKNVNKQLDTLKKRNIQLEKQLSNLKPLRLKIKAPMATSTQKRKRIVSENEIIDEVSKRRRKGDHRIVDHIISISKDNDIAKVLNELQALDRILIEKERLDRMKIITNQSIMYTKYDDNNSDEFKRIRELMTQAGYPTTFPAISRLLMNNQNKLNKERVQMNSITQNNQINFNNNIQCNNRSNLSNEEKEIIETYYSSTDPTTRIIPQNKQINNNNSTNITDNNDKNTKQNQLLNNNIRNSNIEFDQKYERDNKEELTPTSNTNHTNTHLSTDLLTFNTSINNTNNTTANTTISDTIQQTNTTNISLSTESTTEKKETWFGTYINLISDSDDEDKFLRAGGKISKRRK